MKNTPSLKSANFESRPEIEQVERFFDNALAHRANGASDEKTVLDAVSNESSVTCPAAWQFLMDRMPEGQRAELMGAALDGIAEYEARNGEAPRADMVAAAISTAAAVFKPTFADGRSIFDSVTSSNHDQISLQPNRAIIGLYRTLSEAIPFAGYLPVDIGSNEARIIIAQTSAGSAFGEYAVGDSLEGVNLGRPYAVASRMATMTTNGGAGPFTVQFFTKSLPSGEPDTNSTAMKILRGRTNLYVNGVPCGGELRDSETTTPTSPINGSFSIGGTLFTFTGTVNPANGTVTVTPSAALPAGVNVYVEAFIDFDNQPGLIPLVNVAAQTYKLFAVENRILTSNAFSASTQLRNEAGLDPETLATVKFQDQHNQERHYKFLKQARVQGYANNLRTFNLSFPTRGQQLVYSDIIRDLAATLGAASQQMANDTKDCGISHIYTGARFGAILDGCPDYIWKPSGIQKRAGVYLLGVLFGMYKVYYSPLVVQESADGNTSELICIGTSDQPARNAFMLGDAVPATLLPLATNEDLKRKQAFYVRDITQMNPHQDSARRCAIVQITNLNPA